ncbi:MAG: hypothetical protein HFH49_02175 [Lachnospiraceae bacterium]|nr:hypothetical protein [Lachnospiraceae bacterium]
MNGKKSRIFGMLLLVLAGFILPWNWYIVNAETEEAVIYDASEFEVFADRTKEEVGQKYGEALYAGDSYVDGEKASYYEEMYSLENPYAAGKLTADAHKTMTAMAGFYRWLAGVEPLKEASAHSEQLQTEALIRNFEFNHNVSDLSKPEDMPQEFWDLGAKNYVHTILARYSTPRGSITSWMNEGYSASYGWDTVGHRYAIIGSAVSDLQFGYAGTVAAGWEKAYENTMSLPFSAYPAPGYMPCDLVNGKSSAWSIEIQNEKISIEDNSSLAVKVTKTDTGESYECTVANGKLLASSGGSLLVFVQPSPDAGSRYSGSYRVEVTGLADVASGKEAALIYTTEFFDPTAYTPSYVQTVSADGIEEYVLYQSMAAPEKIAYALPMEVTITAENGRNAQVPVKGNWILNEEEQCWMNEADAAMLPPDISDREHVLERCAIHYRISDSIYDSYNSLRISPSRPKAGEEGNMLVYLSLTSADASAVFQLVPQEDGSYIGQKKYDSRTYGEFYEDASGNHVYHIPSFQENDSGEYFSIFYDSTDTCAYVSTQFVRLTVQNPDDSQNPGNSGENQNPGGEDGDQNPGNGNQNPGSGTESGGANQNPGSGDGNQNAGNSGEDQDTGNGTENAGKKGNQTVSCAKTYSKAYGNTPFSLKAKVTKGDGRLTYASSDEKVASVNSKGRVTVKGTGIAVITVKAEETADYYPSEAKVTVKVSPARQTLKSLKAKKGKKLTVSWKKDKRATGYQIQYSTDKKFKKGVKTAPLVKNYKTVSKTISKLKAGKKYYVRVRSYKKAKVNGKNSTLYGAWSSVKRSKSIK